MVTCHPRWGSYHKKPSDSLDQGYGRARSQASVGPHRDTNTEQTGWPVVRGKVFASGAIWRQKMVELCIGNQCQKRLSAGCQVRWLLFNSFTLKNFCQKLRLLYTMLQSWTKSVKNFALSYTQKAYPADRVPLRPLSHLTLVNVVHSGAVIVQ